MEISDSERKRGRSIDRAVAQLKSCKFLIAYRLFEIDRIFRIIVSSPFHIISTVYSTYILP